MWKGKTCDFGLKPKDAIKTGIGLVGAAVGISFLQGATSFFKK